MKWASTASFLAFGFVDTTNVAATAVTPVTKVTELLENMLVKGEKERHDEQIQYAAYKQFCQDTSQEKHRTIKEAGELMEVLQADVDKYAVDAEELGKQIVGHDQEVATWTADQKAATKVREIEKADYDALHKDYTESIEALQQAITVLKKQAHDRSQVALSQVQKSKLIPHEARRAIDLFLQESPVANAYEFQSNSIVDLLEKLGDKFLDERIKLEKDELNASHSHKMLLKDLSAQITHGKQDRDSKVESIAKKRQMKATSDGDLADTTSTRNADQKYLTDLTATCGQKASGFEIRQELRAKELEALSKAIEILKNEVAGHAQNLLPSLTQKAALRRSLAQIRNLRSTTPSQQRAADYLREQGNQLHSHVLSTLAVRVAEDPFGKVKELIKDLILRLVEEASEEAQHKGWCDTELAANLATRNEKSARVETLHAEIDQLEASIAKIFDQLTELSKSLADNDAAVAKAEQLRAEEAANNKKTIKDSQDAQIALAQALTVLREFYAQTAALVQTQQPGAPDIFDSPYTGMQSEQGGIVGLLEVIEADFARLEAETSASDNASQGEHYRFITDSKVDKAQKTQDQVHQTTKRQQKEQELIEKKSDVEGTQQELDAALAYYDKLKPSCVDAGVSYEDRVARRKEEIESLREALRILNGEDLAA